MSTVSEENDQMREAYSVEDELGMVTKFKMSEFEVSDTVSIGLAGRVLLFCLNFDLFSVFFFCPCFSVFDGKS